MGSELSDKMSDLGLAKPVPNEDSPVDVSRRDIATGASPIAARESVVHYQMSMKEDQFTKIQDFKIMTATWNVNGMSPCENVHEWLSVDPEPPDIYAIGFQELDLTKEAFIFNESMREEAWRSVVEISLHPKALYKQVKLVRLVGMMLVVYIKSEHASAVTNVEAETVGTGIMGKLGNKGGVAVRLDFHNTSICFVNSHLAAHLAEFERRNQDYQEIMSRVVFSNFNPVKTIKDHDMVYWLGDLNYRLNELDPGEVKDLVSQGMLKQLQEYDQLKKEKFQRKIFHEFEEGEITFIPTYRYDVGTDNWDTSEKGRAPAWTDRVLWKGEHK